MNEQLKHAWHHVVGISSEEMKQAAAEAEKRYGDIIMLPRPVSRTHPPLSREQKAAQYSPFAALTGYDDAIEEPGRLTQERIVLDEDKKAELNRKYGLEFQCLHAYRLEFPENCAIAALSGKVIETEAPKNWPLGTAEA